MVSMKARLGALTAALALAGVVAGSGMAGAATPPPAVHVFAEASRNCNPVDFCVLVMVSNETGRNIYIRPRDFTLSRGYGTAVPTATGLGWIGGNEALDYLLEFRLPADWLFPAAVEWSIDGFKGASLLPFGTEQLTCRLSKGWSTCPYKPTVQLMTNITTDIQGGVPSPAYMAVPLGELITLTIKNSDPEAYIFSDPDLGLKVTALPEETTVVTFTPSAIGVDSYLVIGSPSRTENGGEIVVEKP